MSCMTDNYRAYTIPDFCRSFGVSRSFAYREISAGRLKTRKAGRRTLILREDASAWLNSLPVRMTRGK